MATIIFDLYGTLVDIMTDEKSDNFWLSFSKYCKKYRKYDYIDLKNKYFELCSKYQIEKEEIEIRDVFRGLFSIDEKKLEKVCQQFRKLSIGFVKCYGGAKKLLERLKEDGHKVYLLSNAQQAFTIPEITKLGLYDYFDGIAISSEYGVKKPNIDFFNKAIRDFEITDENIIMVGNDYECDIKPALELGWKTVFIETNLTPISKEKKNVYGFDGDFIYSVINKLI